MHDRIRPIEKVERPNLDAAIRIVITKVRVGCDGDISTEARLHKVRGSVIRSKGLLPELIRGGSWRLRCTLDCLNVVHCGDIVEELV